MQRLADRLGLPLAQARADVPTLAKQRKLSLETAAREARYRFFAAVAGRRRCRALLLAHHADDQVETFLFNLLRGAGPVGLAGMAADSERTVGRHRLRIIRPLLSVWRSEVDEYLRANRLRWRDDPTNADSARATRNGLRHEVLPLLERTMGRGVKTAVWRTADILAAEEAWLSGWAAFPSDPHGELAVDTLAGEPVARQRRVIMAWLRGHAVPGVGYREVELVRSLLDKENGPAKVNLPGNQHVRRRQGKLFVEP